VVYLNKPITVNYKTRNIVLIFSGVYNKRVQKFGPINQSATQEPVGILNEF
jgi:hypothetical protein